MLTPSRLKLARKRRGVTLAELAPRVGVSAQSLWNYEAGRQQPSEESLRRLSAELRFPVSFFGEPPLEELQSDAVSFRARSKLLASSRDAALSSARFAVEVLDWIDQRFVLPDVQVPTLGNRMTPAVAAEYVRARWGLSDAAAVPNIVHLLESKGVAVFSLSPMYAEVDAFSLWWKQRPYVTLNTKKSGERGRFDAAHELGHLVLHSDVSQRENTKTIEAEANEFASSFLMPANSVRKRVPNQATTDQVIRAKAIWKVAALALTYRLHSLGKLSDWNYRRTCIELGKMGYRLGEPDGIRRESSLLLKKVFDQLRTEGAVLPAMSAELHLPMDQLEGMVFGLAVARAPDEAMLSESDGTNSNEEWGRPQLRLV